MFSLLIISILLATDWSCLLTSVEYDCVIVWLHTAQINSFVTVPFRITQIRRPTRIPEQSVCFCDDRQGNSLELYQISTSKFPVFESHFNTWEQRQYLFFWMIIYQLYRRAKFFTFVWQSVFGKHPSNFWSLNCYSAFLCHNVPVFSSGTIVSLWFSFEVKLAGIFD